MSDLKPTNEIDPGALLVIRIIFAALLMGCLAFLGVAIFHRLQGGQLLAANPWDLGSPLVLAALAGCPVLMVLHWIVPSLAVPAPSGPDPTRLAEPQPPGLPNRAAAQRYQTWFIIGQAMLEGAAFLALIGFFLEGSGISLALALLAMGLMILRFPTAEAAAAFSGHDFRP